MANNVITIKFPIDFFSHRMCSPLNLAGTVVIQKRQTLCSSMKNWTPLILLSHQFTVDALICCNRKYSCHFPPTCSPARWGDRTDNDFSSLKYFFATLKHPHPSVRPSISPSSSRGLDLRRHRHRPAKMKKSKFYHECRFMSRDNSGHRFPTPNLRPVQWWDNAKNVDHMTITRPRNDV